RDVGRGDHARTVDRGGDGARELRVGDRDADRERSALADRPAEAPGDDERVDGAGLFGLHAYRAARAELAHARAVAEARAHVGAVVDARLDGAADLVDGDRARAAA